MEFLLSRNLYVVKKRREKTTLVRVRHSLFGEGDAYLLALFDAWELLILERGIKLLATIKTNF